MRSEKNLLVISPEYYSFVKDQTETLSPEFNRIQVYVRYNPFSELSGILPINSLKPFRKNYLINLEDVPGNVRIDATPLFYLPTNSGYLHLGKKHYDAVLKKMSGTDCRYDIIQAHFLWTSGYAAIKLKDRYNIPVVVTAHGYDIYELPFQDEIWRETILEVLDAADHIVTVSNSNLACLHTLQIKTPVSVIPNGYRDDLFYPGDLLDCRKRLGLPADKKILLTVGNLFPVKGHSFLITALKQVVKERNDVICVIVGTGALKNELSKQIRHSGLDKYVLLAGAKPHQEIPVWINSCDLFVLPSLNEGNPTVMFETLGCGKPFIGTKVGGIPDIITSGDLGFLTEPKNPQGLSQCIISGLSKEWDHRKIALYARQFSWKEITRRLLAIYDSLL